MGMRADGGLQPVFERTLCSGDKELLYVRIAYPLAGRGGEGRGLYRIERFYRRVFGSFQRYCLGRLKARALAALRGCEASGEVFRPYRASLDFTVCHEGGGLLSVRYDRRLCDESGCAVTRCSETWRVKSGALVELKELTGEGRRWKKEVLSAAARSAAAAVEEGRDLLWPDWERLLGRYFSPRRFYLEDGRLMIYFQPCTLGPAEEGAPAFEIPLGGGEASVIRPS